MVELATNDIEVMRITRIFCERSSHVYGGSERKKKKVSDETPQ